MNRFIEKTFRVVDLVLSFVLACTVVYLGFVWYWQSYNAVVLAILLVLGGIFSSFVCKTFHELDISCSGYAADSALIPCASGS